ncbi:MAG: flavodoxin [Planctomycetota bacterium]
MEQRPKMVLIYGSVTGKTEYIAENMVEYFRPELNLELVDVSSIEATDLAAYDFAICGIPTWDVGELEYGWQDIFDKLDDVNLAALTVAMFGLGDQHNYGETYQDAIGIMYEKLLAQGATGKIGFTSTEGHEFVESLAVIDGMFCGLALDEDNQDELTDERMMNWARQLKAELAESKPELFEEANEAKQGA